ncbi:coiled-coil domain-containing protein R3HCC1L-like isoform X1 [Tachypleus tridentatus]|uniref:coiled-coil domain-containing protein R3HCC1L-like isoform X1 n=1 Tax=Tachypleus tridentatus TaxID=6853 RepID=UPI003FD23CAC
MIKGPVEKWTMILGKQFFDENGEYCKHEIAKRLGVSKENVKIQQPKHDYTVFCPQDPDITDEKFGHIIEIYGFPVELKTHDLVNAFSAYKLKDFDIKWVDDTHALGVFASPLVASDVLTIHNPLLKVRPLSEATRESKHKAYRLSEFLQPPKPRPATSAALARRLVSGALGLKVQVSREQQKLEKAKLQEAKEKKRKAAKQRVDIWEGKVD